MISNWNSLLTELTEGQVVGSVLALVIGIVLILLLVAIAIYVIMGIFLTKFNKLVYGKGDVCAWIPYAQTFLLGKLAVNKLYGIILLCVGVVSSFTYSSGTNADGVSTVKSVIPGLSSIYSIASIVTLVLAIIRYNKVKKGELSKEEAARLSDQMSFSKPENTNATVSTENSTPVAPENPPTDNNVPKQYCPNCGAEKPIQGDFCPNCGQKG